MSKLADTAVEAIQALVRKKGLSHRELARQTGVSQRTISRIVAGETIPDLDTIETFLTAFDYEVELVIWPAL